jgi:large subunit ribosomal protein L28
LADLSSPSKPLKKLVFLLCSFVWRFLPLLLELRLCFSILWSAGIDMALKCDLCGKGPHYGNVVSHANNTRRRRWNPNLKRVRAVVAGVHKQIRVCTACIRLGRVTKAA